MYLSVFWLLFRLKILGCVSLGESDPKTDLWSQIIRIMVRQRNRRILVQSGFVGSFDAPWSEWSEITNPFRILPKKRTLNVCKYSQYKICVSAGMKLYFILVQWQLSYGIQHTEPEEGSLYTKLTRIRSKAKFVLVSLAWYSKKVVVSVISISFRILQVHAKSTLCFCKTINLVQS